MNLKHRNNLTLIFIIKARSTKKNAFSQNIEIFNFKKQIVELMFTLQTPWLFTVMIVNTNVCIID